MAGKRKHAARSRKTAAKRLRAGMYYKNYRLTRDQRRMM